MKSSRLLQYEIAEAQYYPTEIPRLKDLRQQFTPFNDRQGYTFPSSQSLLLGLNLKGGLDLIFYRSDFDFLSLVTEKPVKAPHTYIQLSGSRVSKKKPLLRSAPRPTLEELQSSCPSAVPTKPGYKAPHYESIILGINDEPITSLLSLVWVGSPRKKGGRPDGYWDVQTQAKVDAPFLYIQLSPGDSGFDPRTFPLATDCRSKANKKSDITINL